MNKFYHFFQLLSLFSFILSDPDPNFYIFLAFGQSNMDGSGPIEIQDKECPERFKMLAAVDFPKNNRKKGNWYTATPPLCRESSRLSPCDYFGRTMVENLPEKITIGIINVSVAGCSIIAYDENECEAYFSNQEEYMKKIAVFYDNNPFRRLVDMGKLAQNDGVIKGILFHQGESNNGDVNWPNQVKKIYERLLEELNLKNEDVPLLVGELVSQAAGGRNYKHNNIIATLPDLIPNCHVISSEGLPAQEDSTSHFTSEGYREFGKRYAETMLKLLK